MGYIFPVKTFVEFSRKHKISTYGIFLFCTVLSTVKGYSLDIRLDPNVLINFVEPWDGPTWEVFVGVVEFIYSPIGLMVKGLVAFGLFLWLVYLFSGLRKDVSLGIFILPLVSFAIFGVIFHIIGYAFYSITSHRFPFVLFLCIILYALAFYSLVLKEEYNLTTSRSVGALGISFLLVFIISGWSSIAPYLSWI
jgi:hypothetical protein